jgi:hypothetical protein
MTQDPSGHILTTMMLGKGLGVPGLHLEPL